MPPDPLIQRAQQFVELPQLVIRSLRHGPRELALAIAGFVAAPMAPGVWGVVAEEEHSLARFPLTISLGRTRALV